jgi:NADH:ubiquinone reductase (H+-translocating)
MQSNQSSIATDVANNNKIKIVVVGGGAGGLELVRRLGARYGRKSGYDIILIDRNRTHIWKPLLHEVATGSLDANMDEIGYGGHGVRWRYRFFNGAVETIDRTTRHVITAPLVDDEGNEVIPRYRLRYDYLVMAVGGVTNDFGIKGVREHAMFLETRTHADKFRSKLLNACLRVSHESLLEDKGQQLKMTIVGGGATGVELAAELYNAAKALRQYGLESFDEKRIAVSLIEAGPRILPQLPARLADAAVEELRALGVDVKLNTMVSEVTPNTVRTSDGQEIPSQMTLWAAGVKGPEFLAQMDGLELDRLNRLVVGLTLQTTQDPNIFAIGDCCSCIPRGADRPIHPRAQAAHQMAATAFENIVALLDNKPLKEFVYRDHGSLVSLSRFSTVGSLMGNLVGGRMAVEGRLARLAYTSLYRMHLIAVHGWVKGVALIVVGHVNQIVRPRLKLH